MAEIKTAKKISGKTLLIAGAVLVLILLALLTSTGAFASKADPVSQFTTQKSCSFLVMPGISKAICTDGTVYNVVQTSEVATPPLH